MTPRYLVAFAVYAVCISSCARLNYTPRIEVFGAYRDSEALEESVDHIRGDARPDLEVLIGTFPSGVTLGKADVGVSDDAKVELIGKVSVTPQMPIFLPLFWFYDYREDQSWRKKYCYWQVPLTWVTVGMWNLFVPIAWPCNFYEPDSVEGINSRRRYIIEKLRRAAIALQGDILVVTEMGNIEAMNQHGEKIATAIEFSSAQGYVFKKKR